MFQNLGLFPSSGKGRETFTPWGALEVSDLNPLVMVQ
jgi:hypothetical protein